MKTVREEDSKFDMQQKHRGLSKSRGVSPTLARPSICGNLTQAYKVFVIGALVNCRIVVGYKNGLFDIWSELLIRAPCQPIE